MTTVNDSTNMHTNKQAHARNADMHTIWGRQKPTGDGKSVCVLWLFFCVCVCRCLDDHHWHQMCRILNRQHCRWNASIINRESQRALAIKRVAHIWNVNNLLDYACLNGINMSRRHKNTHPNTNLVRSSGTACFVVCSCAGVVAIILRRSSLISNNYKRENLLVYGIVFCHFMHLFGISRCGERVCAYGISTNETHCACSSWLCRYPNSKFLHRWRYISRQITNKHRRRRRGQCHQHPSTTTNT